MSFTTELIAALHLEMASINRCVISCLRCGQIINSERDWTFFAGVEKNKCFMQSSQSPKGPRAFTEKRVLGIFESSHIN